MCFSEPQRYTVESRVACGKEHFEQRLFTCAVSRGLFQYSLHHDLGGRFLCFSGTAWTLVWRRRRRRRRRIGEERLKNSCGISTHKRLCFYPYTIIAQAHPAVISDASCPYDDLDQINSPILGISTRLFLSRLLDALGACVHRSLAAGLLGHFLASLLVCNPSCQHCSRGSAISGE